MSQSEGPQDEQDVVSFERFPILPPELRRGVWHATWTPRDVKPRLKQTDDGPVTVGADLPVSAWVNHESREETLRRYKLAFAIGAHPTRVYFNFDLDTLYLGVRDRQPRALFGAGDLARVQRLSVPKWLPVGLVTDKFAEVSDDFWDQAAFPVPRLEGREKLLERFASSLPPPPDGATPAPATNSTSVTYPNGDRNISELEAGPSMLRAARCLCATHFPALKELKLQAIRDRNGPAARDGMGVPLASAAWALRLRRYEILKMPRLGKKQGDDLFVSHGRIESFLPRLMGPFTDHDWKCMAHSLEFAFGAEGCVAAGSGNDRVVTLTLLSMYHIALSAPAGVAPQINPLAFIDPSLANL
ncbi:hypothetical protein F5X99DRAFT_214800 [Biscogniauxia marginata]|nr:hypothetical protein F5X99DRAFT_214800 [Biscogniauxia marginata]